MTDSTQRYNRGAQPDRALSLGTILFGLILLAIGVLWLLDLAGALDVTWTSVGAVLLILVGVALLVGAREGSHGGLIFLGIVLSVVTLVGSMATWPEVSTDVGERTITPQSIEALEDSYEWGAGDFTLDFRELELPEGETEVTIQLGAGQVEVYLPQNVASRIEWQVGVGDASVLNRNEEGLGLDGTLDSDGYEGEPVQVSLDIQVGVGSIEVQQ